MADTEIPTGPTGAPYGQDQGGSPLPPFPLDNPPMIYNPVPITDPEALANQSSDSEWQLDTIKHGHKHTSDEAEAFTANEGHSVNFNAPEAAPASNEPNPANTFGGSDTELPDDATWDKPTSSRTRASAKKEEGTAAAEPDESPKASTAKAKG